MERLTRWCEAEKSYVSNLLVDGINNSIVMRLAQLEKLGRMEDAEQRGGWVSVKDRLPDAEGTYLVATEKGSVWTLHFWIRLKCWSGTSMRVTHWMPLPDPPKEDA